jgi:uncharacterized membrane protein YdjX (TVP38/TMEM64 family)
MKRTAPLRAVLALGLAAALVGSTVLLYVPAYRGAFNARLGEFLEAVRRFDTWGPVIIGAAFIPACLLFIPGSPLTLFGGFAFGGTLRGLALVTACVSAGSTLGASAAFLIGRTVAREWIENKLAGKERFRAIDAAVGQHGFKVVLLARLSPVFPFNLLNYAFGLTRVSFRDYVLASWIGMLPGTITYVYLGSTAARIANIVSSTGANSQAKSPVQQVLFYTGLAATVVVTIFIARISRRALAALAPDPAKRQV